MHQLGRCLALFSLLVAVAVPPSQAGPLTDTCLVDKMPSATLLFPYFEVDLDDPNGRTTLVSINNASVDPALAKVVVWTDCHLPVFSFDVFLSGNDVTTINLQNVLANGNLVSTSLDTAGQAVFPSCTSPISNPPLQGDALADLQAKLTGQPSTTDGLCYGSERPESRIAIGFLTVDTLNDCSSTLRFPDEEGYFVAGGNGLASNDNVLWGDFYLIDPSENYAQGFEAVGVVADPDRFAGNNIRSFYQVTDDERDDRVPLSSKLRSRFLNGGAFDGSTQFIIWTQRSPELAAFTCGVAQGSCPEASQLRLDMKFFNEDAEESANLRFIPPAFLGKYDVQDFNAGADFGFLSLDSQGPNILVGPPGTFEQRQAWMLQTSSARDRFSVGMAATRLDDLCKISDAGEAQDDNASR